MENQFAEQSDGSEFGERRPRSRLRGADASSDKLYRCAQCTVCGNKGATIQHPGWGGNDVGFLPFPVEKLAAH